MESGVPDGVSPSVGPSEPELLLWGFSGPHHLLDPRRASSKPPRAPWRVQGTGVQHTVQGAMGLYSVHALVPLCEG